MRMQRECFRCRQQHKAQLQFSGLQDKGDGWLSDIEKPRHTKDTALQLDMLENLRWRKRPVFAQRQD